MEWGIIPYVWRTPSPIVGILYLGPTCQKLNFAIVLLRVPNFRSAWQGGKEGKEIGGPRPMILDSLVQTSKEIDYSSWEFHYPRVGWK